MVGRYMLIWGGEVSISGRGHEGAGGFANDLVCIDTANAPVGLVDCVNTGADALCPPSRGWTEMTTLRSSSSGEDGGSFEVILFGGLTGNDESPQRLNDLWRLTARAVNV